MIDLDFNLVEVVLNNSCPLDCAYCFLDNRGKAENMEVETLVNIFKFCKVQQDYRKQEFISIIFTLKEPMLHFNMIRAAISAIDFSLNENGIFLTMNTNGVLLTKESIEYCNNNHIDLHISLDGPKDIHDRGRIYRGNKQGSSWDIIMNIIRKYPENPLMSYMTTIHKQDINRIEEIFHFMSNLPISCWVYAINKFDDWDMNSIAKLEKGIKLFINSAGEKQLSRCRIENTASAAPNLLVTNSIKVYQNGSLFLQPPIINDGAQQGEFLKRVSLGNVNGQCFVPENFVNTDYSTYRIEGENCTESCPQYDFCKRGKKKVIYVAPFSCLRFKHFKRMSNYIKGGDMTEREYKDLRDKMPIYNAVINVTDNCNLRCPYCFTEHNTRVIDLGTIKTTIMFVINDINRFDKQTARPFFNFFGGEPMLHFDDIIVPTVEWVKETGLQNKYNIAFGMTTNGTLFTKDRLRWMSENKIQPLLSIDGDEYTQNDQRPGANGITSFDKILPMIPSILKYFPFTTFRSAIEPRNTSHMFENYLFARKQGFISYFITPNVSAKWTNDDIANACEQLALIGTCMYRDISAGIVPLVWNEFLTAMKLCFKDTETPNEISFNHCGIGTNTIGVATNGDINGCQEHNTYLNHDIFHIGNVFTGLDSVKHRRLLSEYRSKTHPICVDNPNLCKTCSFYNECATNYCPSHNIGNGNSATENSLVTCLWKGFVKRLAYEILAQTIADKNKKMIEFLESQLKTPIQGYSVW